MPALVQATWDDAPHLTTKDKEELYLSIPPHERGARSKGTPILGAGRIYPISEETLVVEPFEMPVFWPRAFALDVGWNVTAAIWGAWDRDSDTVYLYSEYYAGQQPPAVHASGIRLRGDWMVGAIDPAAAGANQKDGSRLLDEYRALGLFLVEADNAVEAGLFATYQRMASGGLKVFSTCPQWLSEFRIYRRGDNGKPIKERDHLMDATRYLIMTGMASAGVEPSEMDEMENRRERDSANDITGY